MNCEQHEEQISAFIDHEVDDAQSAEIFQHLGVCPSCRAFLSAAQRLRATLSEHVVTVPPTLDARISTIPRVQASGLFSPAVQRITTWWKRRLAVPAPAFALLLLMLLMGAVMIFDLTRTTLYQTQAQPSSVVYIMSLSPIEVEAQRIHDKPRVQ